MSQDNVKKCNNCGRTCIIEEYDAHKCRISAEILESDGTRWVSYDGVNFILIQPTFDSQFFHRRLDRTHR